MRLLLIDNRVSQKNIFLGAAKDSIDTIEYDFENDTYDSLLQKIGNDEWESVAFVFHEPAAFYFQLLLKESPMIIDNVKNVDPTLQLWNKFKEFLSQINTPIFDFLACRLYADPNWRYVFEGLEGTSKGGFNIRASSDDTGNLTSGGDWMLESETPEVDAKTLYFNNISQYSGVLTPVPTAYFSDSVNYTLKFSDTISNNCMIRDSDGNLYVGGLFTSVKNVLCNRVVKYNISLNKWEMLGDGFSGQCNALAINPLNGDLYAGGAFVQSPFISPDGTLAIYFGFAKYDKVMQKWVPIKVGNAIGVSGGNINAMVFDSDGNLYIGGTFTGAGAVTATRVIKYNPVNNAYSSLGLNAFTNTGINTIAISPTTGVVYVGGTINFTGLPNINNIAAWNPSTSTWSALGTGLTTGLNGPVNAITVASNGIVYVGGLFSATSGGTIVTLNNIASYNPTTSTWSPLGGTGAAAGLTSIVSCISIQPVSGDLYIGGSFTQVSTVVANTGLPLGKICKYTPGTNTFSAIGSGVNNAIGTGSVNSLLLNENSTTLYIGGNFIFSDGLDTVNISQLDLSTNVYSSLDSINGNMLPTTCNFVKRVSNGDLYACSAVNVYKWDSVNSLWTRLGKGFNGGIVNTMAITPNGIIYVGGTFLQSAGVLLNGIAKYNSILNSFEAIGGATVGVGPVASSVNVITPDGVNLYIGGTFTLAGGVVVNRVARYNSGTNTFSALNLGPNIGVSGTVRAIAIASTGDVYIGGLFATAGGVLMNNITRYGTGSYAALATSTVGVNSDVYAITIKTIASVETIYLGGSFTSAGGVPGFGGIASYTFGSNTFTKIPNVATGGFAGSSLPFVRSIAIDSSNNLYVGGDMTNVADGNAVVSRIAKFNGTAWVPLREGLSGACNSIDLDLSGSEVILYAGGAFLVADNSSSNYISKFYNTQNKWEAIGVQSSITNPGNNVNSIAIKDDGKFYVATSNTTSAAISAPILTWDSTLNRWISITGTLDGTVNSILISKDGNFLYAAGAFTLIDRVGANRIAKYEFGAKKWTPIAADVTYTSGGFDNTCNIIIQSKTSNNTIYIGGFFTASKGITYNRVASYTQGDSTFTALGNGLSDVCNSLAMDSYGNVYAGGLFSQVNLSTPANNIAKWDGAAWSALGDGLNDRCYTLTVDSQNNVYAGGSFNLSGTTELNSIGKWDGTSWSGLIYNGVNGLNGLCRTLTIDQDDNLYAAGFFDKAGGVTAFNIAIWSGDIWTQFNSTGSSSTINTLNYTNIGGVEKIYVGGVFSRFKGLTNNFSQVLNIVDITQRVDPTQSWEPITKTFGDAPFFTSPNTNSTGVITYTSSDEAVAIIDAVTGLVTLTGVGTTLLTASQAGDENYNPQIITTILTVEPIPTPPTPKGEPSQAGIGLLIGGIVIALILLVISILVPNISELVPGIRYLTLILFACLIIGFILLFTSI